jgi:Ca2+-binding RTX toxin-like protein
MRRGLLAGALALLVPASGAQAGTVSGDLVVTFRANPGERNDVTLAPDGDRFRISDLSAPLEVGAGCDRIAEDEAVCGPVSPDGLGVVILTGDGADEVFAETGKAKLGPGSDVGVGTSISGGRGEDTIRGLAPGSVLSGGAGDDDVRGSFGHDLLVGRAGGDLLVGNRGRDRIFGGRGGDHLIGGKGGDRIAAGPGDDLVHAADDRRDEIACGPGMDRANLDRSDHAFGCELVLYP